MSLLAALLLLCSLTTIITAHTTTEICPREVTTDEIGKCDPLLGKEKDSGSILGYTCYIKSGNKATCPKFKGKRKHYEMIEREDEITSSQLDPETQQAIEFKYKICNYEKICLGDNKANPECALHDYINPEVNYDNTKCPSDLDPFLLTITRQYFQTTVNNVKSLKTKAIGGDLNFMHYGPKYYPQWLLSYYKKENVLLIFFQPSEAFRIPDFVAALSINYKQYTLKLNGKKINILSGIAKIMDNAIEMHDLLLVDLEYTFKKYNIIGSKKEEMRFVISGYSLGGCYAPYFFLGLYGNMNNYIGEYANEIVGQYLPTLSQIDKVSVIMAGSPLIVYHDDVNNIPNELRNRIFSIILGMDPIPMLWSGKNPLHTSGKKNNEIYSNGKWFKLLYDVNHRLKFGSNAAIGLHQYVLSYAGLNDETINNIQKMDKHAIEAHLANGGECLWDYKYLGKSFTEAAIKDFLSYHAKEYFPLIDNSGCLVHDKIKNIQRTTFDIQYCKPKKSLNEKRVSISECYNYDTINKKSKDFLNQKDCKCYKGHGILKHFVEGVSRLIGKPKNKLNKIGKKIDKKIKNSYFGKKIIHSKFLRRIGFH